jgi:glycosyltransferase involved in cell wall biosynthesis
MHLFWLVLFALITLFWMTYGLKVAYGALRIPWLKDCAPAADADCPRISVLFAARDEEEKLPGALVTLVAVDYPNLEIVAVDDRSSDATARILDQFALNHPQLRVVHVHELPAGWLGKPHALQKAYEASSGEWLVFTDADVKFQADALRRVAVSNPNSRAYVGVGAFQMLKRSAYEACGTHRRLAMEVIDDMKLGKLVKQGGFRSGVAVAQDAVSVEWHLGLGNLIRGLEKNCFAAAGFRVGMVALQIASMLLFNVAPFLGLAFGVGWVRVLAAIAVLAALGFHVGGDVVTRVSPLYCLTLPLGAALFSYILLRSTVITLHQGGIYWRETFYKLEELRRGLV